MTITLTELTELYVKFNEAPEPEAAEVEEGPCDGCGYSKCAFKCAFCKTHCSYQNTSGGHIACRYGHMSCNGVEGGPPWDPCVNCGGCTEHGCLCWTCVKCKKKKNPEEMCQGCEKCHTCGCPCPKSESGRSKQAPWEKRGTVVEIDRERATRNSWEDEWPFAPGKCDPVQAAAEFYLLEAVENAVGPGWSEVSRDRKVKLLMQQAKAMRSELVELWDHNFRMYVAMACWGESRYHQCIGYGRASSAKVKLPVLPECTVDRSVAWTAAKQIEEQVGTPQAYYDLYELFMEMDGRSVGGKRWASAIRLVADRCAGILTPDIFVDRVFSMQHNGGSLLNKVMWGTYNLMGWDVRDIMFKIGPAHHSNPPDWALLCSVARSDVSRLFDRYIAVSDLIRKENRMPALVGAPLKREDFWETVPAFIKDLAKRDSGAAFDAYIEWDEEQRSGRKLRKDEYDEPGCTCEDCLDQCGTCCYKQDDCQCCGSCDDYPCCCDVYEEEEPW